MFLKVALSSIEGIDFVIREREVSFLYYSNYQSNVCDWKDKNLDCQLVHSTFIEEREF